jgi:hypothetical protein
MKSNHIPQKPGIPDGYVGVRPSKLARREPSQTLFAPSLSASGTMATRGSPKFVARGLYHLLVFATSLVLQDSIG